MKLVRRSPHSFCTGMKLVLNGIIQGTAIRKSLLARLIRDLFTASLPLIVTIAT